MNVAYVPVITTSWDDLRRHSTDLLNRANAASSFFEQASINWTRFRSAYIHSATQEQVYTALDELGAPMQEWAGAVSAANRILIDFCDSGSTLQARAEELTEERPGIYAKYQEAEEAGEDADPADAAAISAFNERAVQLKADWDALVENTASSLRAISGGTDDMLAAHAGLGERLLPEADWVALSSGLNERFGNMSPFTLAHMLSGLSADELRLWADANPEAAAVLAGNELMGPYAADSPEHIMMMAMRDGADLTEAGVMGIRNAWDSLDQAGQERLLLLFPAVFGSLNGVPMAARARANTITVPGVREINEQAIRDLKRPQRPALDNLNEIQANQAAIDYSIAEQAYQDELNRLEQIRKGLDHAMLKDLQVVAVGLEGNGRILVMNGTPSPATTTAAVLVPGTGATLGSLEDYTGKLANVDRSPAPDHVSFYYQDVDLPQRLIVDNATSAFNEAAAPRLAAFDYALDLEVPAETRSTYIGYSAGAGALGTAERVGLDSSNIVYVAPSGTGHEVGSPQDTENQDANRYWVQSRDDTIAIAQAVGGAAQGDGGPSDPVGQMGAQRLESGFLNHDKGGPLVSGHNEYFRPGSTSALNMQGVIRGTSVYPHIPEEIHTYIGGYWIDNPMETRPEDYAGVKMQSIPTESCPAQ